MKACGTFEVFSAICYPVYIVREEDCRPARHIAWINLIRNTVAISALAFAMQAGLRDERKVEGLQYRYRREI